MSRRLAGAALIALAALAAPATGAGIPQDLPGDARALADGLDRVADADDVPAMRDQRATLTGPLERVLEHAGDLADREGALLATYVERLDEQLAAGNRSDAASLARAAASTTRDTIVPAADAWAENRTALVPGGPSWQGEAVAVPVVLVNPPPAGVGALDVEVHVEDATVTGAEVAVGRGETTVDAANGTARLASFDAAALAKLDAASRERVVVGTVLLDGDELAPGDEVRVDPTTRALATPEGAPAPAIGVADTARVPEASGGLFSERVLAVAGVAAGAAVLVALARRLEV